MSIARISSHVVQEYLSEQVSGHKSIPVSTNQLEVLSIKALSIIYDAYTQLHDVYTLLPCRLVCLIGFSL